MGIPASKPGTSSAKINIRLNWRRLQGVIAPGLYPLLRSGQINGLIGGLQCGAAEYETRSASRGKADGMDAAIGHPPGPSSCSSPSVTFFTSLCGGNQRRQDGMGS